MSNQQQGSNAAPQEAPKSATPTEIKSGQQQNQGRRQAGRREACPAEVTCPFWADGEPGIVPGFFFQGRRR